MKKKQLINLIEELKKEIVDLKSEVNKFSTERDLFLPTSQGDLINISDITYIDNTLEKNGNFRLTFHYEHKTTNRYYKTEKELDDELSYINEFFESKKNHFFVSVKSKGFFVNFNKVSLISFEENKLNINFVFSQNFERKYNKTMISFRHKENFNNEFKNLSNIIKKNKNFLKLEEHLNILNLNHIEKFIIGTEHEENTTEYGIKLFFKNQKACIQYDYFLIYENSDFLEKDCELIINHVNYHINNENKMPKLKLKTNVIAI